MLCIIIIPDKKIEQDREMEENMYILVISYTKLKCDAWVLSTLSRSPDRIQLVRLGRKQHRLLIRPFSSANDIRILKRSEEANWVFTLDSNRTCGHRCFACFLDLYILVMPWPAHSACVDSHLQHNDLEVNVPSCHYTHFHLLFIILVHYNGPMAEWPHTVVLDNMVRA